VKRKKRRNGVVFQFSRCRHRWEEGRKRLDHTIKKKGKEGLSHLREKGEGGRDLSGGRERRDHLISRLCRLEKDGKEKKKVNCLYSNRPIKGGRTLVRKTGGGKKRYVGAGSLIAYKKKGEEGQRVLKNIKKEGDATPVITCHEAREEEEGGKCAVEETKGRGGRGASAARSGKGGGTRPSRKRGSGRVKKKGEP